jgi:DNA-binding transcriptional LysR family regulator
MEYISDIRWFIKVVQQKSFSTAAAVVGTSQSSISKRVARLEKSLGVQLLKRSTRHLALTEAGMEFYVRAERILADLDEACEAAAALNVGLEGSLRVHSTLGVGQSFVAPAVAEFTRDNPDISVELILAPNKAINLLQQDIDVTIRLSTERDSFLNHTSLSHRNLGAVRYLVCGSPDYFRRAGTPETPRDLARHNCLILTNQGSPHSWRFTGPDGEYAVTVSGTYKTNSGTALYEALRQGVGLARMLEFHVNEDLADGRLVSVFADLTRPQRFITAYYPRTEHNPAKTEAFLSFLQRALEKRLAKEPART